jgi:hypothetical protein
MALLSATAPAPSLDTGRLSDGHVTRCACLPLFLPSLAGRLRYDKYYRSYEHVQAVAAAAQAATSTTAAALTHYQTGETDTETGYHQEERKGCANRANKQGGRSRQRLAGTTRTTP